MNWIRTDVRLPSNDDIVEVKIDDADGCRNQQKLRYHRNMWYTTDLKMYVYFRPTHWRPIENAVSDELSRIFRIPLD